MPFETQSDLSSTTLDEFAVQVGNLLKEWNFPDADHVHFDEQTRDLIISGKRRSSRGKGMRSITHAAFIIGLMEFCLNNELFHPGFVVLDSPLLAYRQPENNEDDLSGTDVQDKFYEYLSKWNDRQILVIENVNPPASIRAGHRVFSLAKIPIKTDMDFSRCMCRRIIKFLKFLGCHYWNGFIVTKPGFVQRMYLEQGLALTT